MMAQTTESSDKQRGSCNTSVVLFSVFHIHCVLIAHYSLLLSGSVLSGQMDGSAGAHRSGRAAPTAFDAKVTTKDRTFLFSTVQRILPIVLLLHFFEPFRLQTSLFYCSQEKATPLKLFSDVRSTYLCKYQRNCWSIPFPTFYPNEEFHLKSVITSFALVEFIKDHQSGYFVSHGRRPHS